MIIRNNSNDDKVNSKLPHKLQILITLVTRRSFPYINYSAHGFKYLFVFNYMPKFILTKCSAAVFFSSDENFIPDILDKNVLLMKKLNIPSEV